MISSSFPRIWACFNWSSFEVSTSRAFTSSRVNVISSLFLHTWLFCSLASATLNSRFLISFSFPTICDSISSVKASCCFNLFEVSTRVNVTSSFSLHTWIFFSPASTIINSRFLISSFFPTICESLSSVAASCC